jgi:hypothetical protein
MSGHMIQFASKEDYKRAIVALREVPFTRVGLPDLKMGVFDAHIEALKKYNIPFTDLTKDVTNGSTTAIQS